MSDRAAAARTEPPPPRDETRWRALYAAVLVELAALVGLFHALTRWAE